MSALQAARDEAWQATVAKAPTDSSVEERLSLYDEEITPRLLWWVDRPAAIRALVVHTDERVWADETLETYPELSAYVALSLVNLCNAGNLVYAKEVLLGLPRPALDMLWRVVRRHFPTDFARIAAAYKLIRAARERK